MHCHTLTDCLSLQRASTNSDNEYDSDECKTDEWRYAAGVMRIIQTARPQVQPNDGFLRQLHEFHESLEGED